MNTALSVVLSLACFQSCMAQPQALASTILLWESTEWSIKGIQVQITHLYDTLYELRKGGAPLQTRMALMADESGESLLALVKREELYIGSGENFPRALPLLICMLNPEKCTIRNDDKGIAGVKWTKFSNANVTIPDLRLQPITQVQPYAKKRGDQVSNIVLRDRMGCQVFDKECEARIRHLNPNAAKLKPEFAGTILVPSTGYTARVPLPAAASKDIAEGAITSKYGVNQGSAELFINNVIAAPPPQINFNSNKASQGQTKIADVLQIIRYKPFDRGGDRLLTIGLVDSAPDLQHCALDLKDLANDKHLMEYDSKGSRLWTWKSQNRSTTCGAVSNLDVSDEEHGTHLLGLWFSRKTSPSGEGMLPRSNRTLLGIGPFEYGKATQAAQYMQVGRVLEMMGLDMGVINLSWGLPASVALANSSSIKPRLDNIGAAIARYGALHDSGVLFVAAAGNDKRRLDVGACDITPVCGPPNRYNVLTVTALNNNEKDPDVAGNYGRLIDIGVPAVNILSTLRQDLIGSASGSSQAAAVASAASAMLIYGTGLTRQQARNRLIYTSDLTPTLQKDDGKLFGGRLNFERAAAINSAQIDVSGLEKPADVIFAPGDPILRIIPGNDTSRMEELRMSSVRRIVRKANTDPNRTHTIFYTGEKPGSLFRVDGSLDSDSQKIKFIASFLDAPKFQGPLEKIRSYTSPGPNKNN